jgi:hypothetical protein
MCFDKMNSNDNSILTFAQYGNILVPSKDLAKQRGSGNFNPPPLWSQSTNRGPAMMNAFDKNKQGLPLPVDPSSSNSAFLNDPQEFGDDLRKRAYVVGSTGLHSDTVSWTVPSIGNGAQNKYVEWALKSLMPGGITSTPLLLYFFSTENVNYIQNRTRNEVQKHTGIQVNNQSIDEILIIMRNHMINAYSGSLPNNSGKITNRGPKECSIEERLIRLNKSVIEEIVSQIFSGINQYKQYTKDISSLPMPLSQPVYTSMSGSRQLTENIGFNSALEQNVYQQSFNQRYNIL